MLTYPLERNLALWDRGLSTTAGVALIVRGLKRHALVGSETLAGAALLARGLSGYCPVYHASGFTTRREDRPEIALSGARGYHLKASVTIARAPQEVFAFWRRFENLPRFIRHLDRVESLPDGRSRWTLRGPAGLRMQWEAEIINEIAPELLAWRSLRGSDLVSAGSVLFKAVPRGGTELTVTMQYAPPGGALTEAAAVLLGRSPKADLREDLRRLKSLLEAGEVPTTNHQASGERSRFFRAARWAAR